MPQKNLDGQRAFPPGEAANPSELPPLKCLSDAIRLRRSPKERLARLRERREAKRKLRRELQQKLEEKRAERRRVAGEQGSIEEDEGDEAKN